MSSKYVNGTYASGYSLSTTTTYLTIGVGGFITGSDVYSSHQATILNRGLISDSDGLGIILTDGGAVTNAGTIVSPSIGIELRASGNVVNSGTINTTGVQAYGVYLYSGGNVTNSGHTALIESYTTGVGTDAGLATVINGGTIAGTYLGIDLKSGGSVTNNAHATIVGGRGIQVLTGSVGTVANAGTIDATGSEVADYAILLQSGGTIANKGAAALIEGSYGGIKVAYGGAGTVSNSGTIQGVAVGIVLQDGGSIDNTDAAALISGETGILLATAATIVNYGTIASTNGGNAVQFNAAGGLLIDGAGSVFIGAVGGGSGTLELAGSGGTLSGLGTQFAGFVSVSEAAGANWTLVGSNTDTSSAGIQIGGALTNSGTLDANEVYVDPGASLTNTKLLDATEAHTGVVLGNGGNVVNKGTGALIEGFYGVYVFNGTGTVTNYGTIESTQGASGDAVEFGASGSVLIDEAGSRFIGYVVGYNSQAGGGGGGTLELAGTGGTLSGLGTQFVGFVSVSEAAGASWTLVGSNTDTSSAGIQIGGALTNSGTLDANEVYVDPGASLTNTKLLDATEAHTGVVLGNGGNVVNKGTGALIEGFYGVYVFNGTGTVTNYGTIESTQGSGGDAVEFGASGSVLIDEAGSRFIGYVVGGGGTLKLAGIGGTISNLGTSFAGFGTVDVLAGASWTANGTSVIASGTIAGLIDSGTLTLAGTSTASGAISGAGTLNLAGIESLNSGTSLTVSHLTLSAGRAALGANFAYAGSFIESGGNLVVGSHILTLTGAAKFTGGTISGTGSLVTRKATSLKALSFSGGAAWTNFSTVTASGGLAFRGTRRGGSRLSNEAGAIFDITANTGITIAAGGGNILNKGVIEKTGGTGLSIIAPAIVNTGAIRVTTGTLDLSGPVAGVGKEAIGIKGTLELGGSVAAGQTISFAGATGELVLHDPSGSGLGFAGTVAGFRKGDLLDLATFAFVAGAKPVWTQNGAKGTLTLTEGSKTAKITLFGQYAAAGFHAAKNAAGGTTITYSVPTQIAQVTSPHH